MASAISLRLAWHPASGPAPASPRARHEAVLKMDRQRIVREWGRRSPGHSSADPQKGVRWRICNAAVGSNFSRPLSAQGSFLNRSSSSKPGPLVFLAMLTHQPQVGLHHPLLGAPADAQPTHSDARLESGAPPFSEQSA